MICQVFPQTCKGRLANSGGSHRGRGHDPGGLCGVMVVKPDDVGSRVAREKGVCLEE